MRLPIVICLATSAIAACSDDGATPVAPMVKSGGGIGDGPIDGVANIYVIDDATRAGIPNADVMVGAVAGTTDADGLVVIKGVKGPQTVLVKAEGYRSEMWVDANGANMTFDLKPPTEAVPATATISGSIPSFATVPVTHTRAAIVTYLQSDELGNAANNIATAGKMNICSADPCTFSVTTRTGTIGLLALIIDYDTHGTTTQTDDTFEIVGYASKNGITVSAGATMSGVTLDVVSTDNLATETVDFGTPPSGLTTMVGIVGIETADGLYQIGQAVSATMTSIKVPKLAAVGATGYRLSGIAGNGGDPPTQSVVLRRKQTSSALSAGTWINPPTNVSISRTHAAWTPVSGATLTSIELDSSATTQVLGITLLDPTVGTVDIPDFFALPSGTLTAKVSAIGAPGLDVTSFELDTDKDKLSEVGVTPGQVAN